MYAMEGQVTDDLPTLTVNLSAGMLFQALTISKSEVCRERFCDGTFDASAHDGLYLAARLEDVDLSKGREEM